MVVFISEHIASLLKGPLFSTESRLLGSRARHPSL
jgi:hypothetical protein